MKYLIEADAIALLNNLTAALAPFARAQQVTLGFSAEIQELMLRYHPEEISISLVSLLCRVITFTPQGETVRLHVAPEHSPSSLFLRIQIRNSGANLSRIGEIVKNCSLPVSVIPDADGTLFDMRWTVAPGPGQETGSSAPNAQAPPQIRGFYAEIRKRLTSHFTELENKIEALAAKKPQDAVFLQKVNAVISAHLGDEHFGAGQLSKSMAMSRSKLLRRMKSVIRESPGEYIRCFRLQKAKDLLQTSELTIGEVAFQTGFPSPSHFTRVFTAQFGVRPSAFRRHGKKESDK